MGKNCWQRIGFRVYHARCEHWQGYWHDVADHLEMEAGWVILLGQSGCVRHHLETGSSGLSSPTIYDIHKCIYIYIHHHIHEKIPVFHEYIPIHFLFIPIHPQLWMDPPYFDFSWTQVTGEAQLFIALNAGTSVRDYQKHWETTLRRLPAPRWMAFDGCRATEATSVIEKFSYHDFMRFYVDYWNSRLWIKLASLATAKLLGLLLQWPSSTGYSLSRMLRHGGSNYCGGPAGKTLNQMEVLMGKWSIYHLVMTHIAMENHHFW